MNFEETLEVSSLLEQVAGDLEHRREDREQTKAAEGEARGVPIWGYCFPWPMVKQTVCACGPSRWRGDRGARGPVGAARPVLGLLARRPQSALLTVSGTWLFTPRIRARKRNGLIVSRCVITLPRMDYVSLKTLQKEWHINSRVPRFHICHLNSNRSRGYTGDGTIVLPETNRSP